jgi:hypothetical protein
VRLITRPFRPLSHFLVLLLAVAGASPLPASQVRRLSLEELTHRSGRVFSGRCVDVRVLIDPVLGQPVTRVTLEVERGVKGNAQKKVTFKMLGNQRGAAEKGVGIEGVPRFSVGEEVVLFLYGESHSGLTSPVGFGQGKFSIVRDKHGERVAVNGFHNRHLFEGLSADARARLRDGAERWRDRDGVPPEALLDMVARLTK